MFLKPVSSAPCVLSAHSTDGNSIRGTGADAHHLQRGHRTNIRDLYTSEAAADLPAGTLAAKPDYRIRVAEDFSGHDGRSAQVVSKFNGVVQREGKPDEAISFGLLGYFNYTSSSFVHLELEFTPNLGKSPPAALAACSGYRVERWDDGSSHLVVALNPQGQ
jgi:hypothetical protein